MLGRVFGIVMVAVLIVGCGEEEREVGSNLEIPESVHTTAVIAPGTPTVEFNVPDMMCPEGCGAKTKEILAGQPGAKDVVIDFPAKTAIVAVNEDQFDAKRALDALVDHGFDQSTLKNELTESSARPSESAIQ
jgi:copper chaperone CopZ